MQLHSKVYGQGEPLIILHGLLGSSDNWHSICLKLAQRFQVFALDQRNHGRSPHSGEMNYSIMATDVDQFLLAEHLSSANVLGHSMGGKTAMQFALLFPQKIDYLIIVDIAPRTYPPNHEQILAALMALSLGKYETRKQIEQALAPSIPDLSLRQFLLKNLGRNPGGHFYWKIGLSEISRNYTHLREGLSSNRPCFAPALFVRGESSPYLGGADSPEIRALFPRAQFQTIPGAAHLVHVENPEVFLQTILQFFVNHQKKIHKPGADNASSQAAT